VRSCDEELPMYAVSGASGHFGRLAVLGLLDAGTDPGEIVAVARSVDKVADLADRGVTVRAGDYDQPDSLPPALDGVDTLLLVSGSEPGRRIPQHAAVIDAAVGGGVTRVAYTSILRADTNPIVLAPEHKATEELLVASGLSYTFLRNGWYLENYTRQLAQYLAQGAIVGATHNGRIAGAARADYAAAAVTVLTGGGHDNAIYELGGPAFTMADLAAVITAVSGTEVVVKDVPVQQYIEILKSVGLDEATATFVAALDEATARGDIDTDSADLARLVGRPLTPLEDVVRAAL
jgi:NAD(P)H dehydrogenase (quinone)